MPIASCLDSYSVMSFHRISLALDQAYRTVNETCKFAPFLLSKSMKISFQTLYNSCVEYAVDDMVKNKKFPSYVVAQYKLNAAKNHYYLQLEANNCRLTFSNSNSLTPESLPRNSIFRQAQSFENQPTLYEDLDEQSTFTSYGIILHKKSGENGNASPVAALGIPDKEYKQWLDYRTFSQILTSLPSPELTNDDNEYLQHLRNEISKKVENGDINLDVK